MGDRNRRRLENQSPINIDIIICNIASIFEQFDLTCSTDWMEKRKRVNFPSCPNFLGPGEHLYSVEVLRNVLSVY